MCKAARFNVDNFIIEEAENLNYVFVEKVQKCLTEEIDLVALNIKHHKHCSS